MAAPTPPLHVMRYDVSGHDEWRTANLADAHERVAPGKVTWINLDTAQDAETLAAIERAFNVHPLTMEDIRNTRQRPKVEEYPGYLYIVTQMVVHDDERGLRSEQVSMLMGDGWLITIQETQGDVFDGVRQRIRQGGPRIRRSGADYLAYALLDAVVDGYFPVLQWFSERTEAIEEDVIADVGHDVRERLQRLRRDLLTMRRLAWPQRDAISALERGETRWFHDETKTYLRDVSDHITRVIDMVEVDRELAASLTDLHLANLAQRSNEVMKVLTIVATIFIPLTFVAGVYGMNFQYMPELETRWGYPVVMTFMAALGIGMYVAFKRRRWI